MTLTNDQLHALEGHAPGPWKWQGEVQELAAQFLEGMADAK